MRASEVQVRELAGAVDALLCFDVVIVSLWTEETCNSITKSNK